MRSSPCRKTFYWELLTVCGELFFRYVGGGNWFGSSVVKLVGLWPFSVILQYFG